MPEITAVQNAVSTETSPSATSGQRYVVDPTVSRFSVQAFASGLLSAFGHNPKVAIRDLKGEIFFDPAHMEQATMHLAIRADSLTVTDSISDKDRRDIESEMREKVLEIGKYPEIVFDVTSVTITNADNQAKAVQANAVLNGQLTLHGETRPQKVPATLAVTGDMLRAFGELSLRQSNYNIRPVSAIGGGLKVKDEVKFIFDIVARKQS